MYFPDVRQRRKKINADVFYLPCFSNTSSTYFCLMWEMKCASMLLYNDAFVFLCFLLIHLQEKYRGMLMQMERREIEYQV